MSDGTKMPTLALSVALSADDVRALDSFIAAYGAHVCDALAAENARLREGLRALHGMVNQDGAIQKGPVLRVIGDALAAPKEKA